MSVPGLVAADAAWAPLWVLLAAASPVGEVRVSIPLAILHFGMGWGEAVVWSLLGNFAIVPLLFWLLPLVERFLRRSRRATRGIDWLYARTRRRHSASFGRYEEVAMVLFIAIPLPGTGAWMGAIAAYVFGLGPRKALPYAYAGITIACFLVTVVTLLFSDAAQRWFL